MSNIEFQCYSKLLSDLVSHVERLADQTERLADSQELLAKTAEHFFDCMCDEGEFSTLQISIYEP